MKWCGSPGLGEIYLFRAAGKMRTFGSGLVAICGFSLLFLAAEAAFPSRALPGCAVEVQHFKKSVSMAEFFRAHVTFVFQFTECFSRGLGSRFDGEFCQQRKKKSVDKISEWLSQVKNGIRD